MTRDGVYSGDTLTKQGKNMNKINVYEAPQGYIAVEPEEFYNQSGECEGCCFDQAGCSRQEAICWAEGREDGRDVIFKPVLH